jgi:hypothetical protein
MTKTLNHIILFFLHQNRNIFFSNIGNQNIFLEKKHTPPGDRKTNIIHTKLRHRCSGLNADLYRVNLKNDPRCVCGHLFEDAIHFFLDCPLYQHDRTSLFNYFNNIVQKRRGVVKLINCVEIISGLGIINY